MRQFLQKTDDPMIFSNAADYPSDTPPFEAPTGFQWQQGVPPEGATPYVPPTISDELDKLFMTLTPDQRAQFLIYKPAIKLALEEGDTLAALGALQRIEVSSDLQPIKDGMIALFPLNP